MLAGFRAASASQARGARGVGLYGVDLYRIVYPGGRISCRARNTLEISSARATTYRCEGSMCCADVARGPGDFGKHRGILPCLLGFLAG